MVVRATNGAVDETIIVKTKLTASCGVKLPLLLMFHP